MASGQPWNRLAPPPRHHGWTWQPHGLDDLPRIRSEFRHRITNPDAGSSVPTADAIEECVLALDELMSNGLRHGRAPVEVEVCTTDRGLLLLVSDRAADNPPRPTSTRDPSEGGMGLGMVADVSLACGWEPLDDIKMVWALMPIG